MYLTPGLTRIYIYTIIYLISCDVFNKWGYCNYPYTRGIPCLYQAIRVVKISQFFQVQRISGYRVPLSYQILTPYPVSQVVGLFFRETTRTP